MRTVVNPRFGGQAPVGGAAPPTYSSRAPAPGAQSTQASTSTYITNPELAARALLAARPQLRKWCRYLCNEIELLSLPVRFSAQQLQQSHAERSLHLLCAVHRFLKAALQQQQQESEVRLRGVRPDRLWGCATLLSRLTDMFGGLA